MARGCCPATSDPNRAGASGDRLTTKTFNIAGPPELHPLVRCWPLIAQECSELPQFLTDFSQSPADEMRDMVRKIGGYRQAGETIDVLLRRVAARMNGRDVLTGPHAVTYSKVYGYWYPDSRHPDKDIPARHWRRAFELAALVDEENAVRTAAWTAHVANDVQVMRPGSAEAVRLVA